MLVAHDPLLVLECLDAYGSGVSQLVLPRQHNTPADFLLGLIPTTFVGAFTDGEILPVLLIATLCGFAFTKLGGAGKLALGTICNIVCCIAVARWQGALNTQTLQAELSSGFVPSPAERLALAAAVPTH